ncbi:MAG: hypothetical protein II859_00745 [Bacteroidales bacterium]|nr:hypothetical protein [Bacteroidales bacterium]
MKHFAAFLTFVFGLVSLIGFSGYFMMCFEESQYTHQTGIDYQMSLMEMIGQDIFVFVILLLLFFLFAVCYSWYHRLNKKKKDILDPNDINGPFVLYLRSFVDDKVTGKSVSVLSDERTEEEVLVEILTDIAPVYAIGDPKDIKMPLGASRVYVDDDHWKSTVQTMAERAEVVALRLGKTDSFWWEVRMVLENIPLEKILFIVPESKTFSKVSNLYKILLDHGVDIENYDITVEKKRRGSISSFLFFDQNKIPKTCEVQIARFTRFLVSYADILRSTLAEFRAMFGLSSPKSKSIRYSRVFFILLILGLIGMVVGQFLKDYAALTY